MPSGKNKAEQTILAGFIEDKFFDRVHEVKSSGKTPEDLRRSMIYVYSKIIAPKLTLLDSGVEALDH